jgi:hypothetical protein
MDSRAAADLEHMVLSRNHIARVRAANGLTKGPHGCKSGQYAVGDQAYKRAVKV